MLVQLYPVTKVAAFGRTGRAESEIVGVADGHDENTSYARGGGFGTDPYASGGATTTTVRGVCERVRS